MRAGSRLLPALRRDTRIFIAVASLVVLVHGAGAHGAARGAPAQQFDVVVYGATPGGVMAAVAASRGGAARVAVISDSAHVGGMSASGLGKTDTGSTAAIGGLALEFFAANGRHYGSAAPQWDLEPHVAEALFRGMLAAANVTVVPDARVVSASMDGTTIVSVALDDAAGTTVKGAQFVDASYEGDLLAAAGASWVVGREGVAQYNESYAGRMAYSPKNQIDVRIDPFEANGKTLLPLVQDAAFDGAPPGGADRAVESYNFRLCVTRNASNRVPFARPPGYNASQFELMRRLAAAVGPDKVSFSTFIGNIGAVPNGKYDMNNGGGISTDLVGGAWEYPTATYAERRSIWQAHKDYTQGLLWFLASDPALPAAVHQEAAEWGLCADEFTDTDHWPWQLYVREARRMVGDDVFTQRHWEAAPGTFGSAVVGVGGYHIDSQCVPRSLVRFSHAVPADTRAPHSNVARFPCPAGTFHCQPAPPGQGSPTPYVLDEGDLEIGGPPFEIPYWAMLPKRREVGNLLVPVAASASHVGFCTLRLEPTWMVLGQAAGTAAAMALADGIPVQNVSTPALHAKLLAAGAVLSAKGMAPDAPGRVDATRA